MPSLNLLVVGEEKLLSDFEESLESCRRYVGPIKVFSAHKAVDAVGRLQKLVQTCGVCHAAFLSNHFTAQGKEEFSDTLRKVLKERHPDVPVICWGKPKSGGEQGKHYHATLEFSKGGGDINAVVDILKQIQAGQIKAEYKEKGKGALGRLGSLERSDSKSGPARSDSITKRTDSRRASFEGNRAPTLDRTASAVRRRSIDDDDAPSPSAARAPTMRKSVDAGPPALASPGGMGGTGGMGSMNAGMGMGGMAPGMGMGGMPPMSSMNAGMGMASMGSMNAGMGMGGGMGGMGMGMGGMGMGMNTSPGGSMNTGMGMGGMGMGMGGLTASPGGSMNTGVGGMGGMGMGGMAPGMGMGGMVPMSSMNAGMGMASMGSMNAGMGMGMTPPAGGDPTLSGMMAGMSLGGASSASAAAAPAPAPAAGGGNGELIKMLAEEVVRLRKAVEEKRAREAESAAQAQQLAALQQQQALLQQQLAAASAGMPMGLSGAGAGGMPMGI
ncbi:hypothetical protein HYH03_005988 [Edaphochlamys debaryana]|uniref:Uncharacterized protein n=1 Tax=Edaphochlamys debaryana TaxID=47281 RepID=A0A835YED7_9CHLO|nr:hypothetical protein HYH03_005988 [Edaphochlamys debaryana]|eukprot:KAG2496069.1 hypothetical protein HYH03_005988 [Edaphochlamys debaryana]